MASVLKVDKLDPQSGTALEIGTSGDTITVPTGAGLTVVDEVKTNKISPSSGVAFTLGDSGDTFTVPSGATIVNSGTATGFGGGKIGQVLRSESTSSTTIATTTYSTISLSQAITCSASSSKVLIMGCIMASKAGSNTDRGFGYRIRRDTTNVFETTTNYYNYDSSQNSSFNDGDATSFFYLDSPSSTSAITYSIYCATMDSHSLVFQSDANQSNLVLMEVLA